MYNEKYVRQVTLLIQCLPAIREQDFFALKGGTAINLILNDLPRLSVDIDLTYIPFTDREESLRNIQNALLKISKKIQSLIPGCRIQELRQPNSKLLQKLLIYKQDTMIKIEPNLIMRGTIYPIEKKALSEKVAQLFEVFIDDIPMLTATEVYAGKLCAALNRQHPRDLFDVKLLLDKHGITDELRQAFVVYLACDVRPMHELLIPNLLNIAPLFAAEFSAMTNHEITLEELLLTREKLIRTINYSLTDAEREFLLSIKLGMPNFNLLNIENISRLPAIKWKVLNIAKMDKTKHKLMMKKLEAALSLARF